MNLHIELRCNVMSLCIVGTIGTPLFVLIEKCPYLKCSFVHSSM